MTGRQTPASASSLASASDRQTEALRASVLGDRTPVLSVAQERTWRALVASGQTREAAALQMEAARDYRQENRAISMMNRDELQAYSTATGRGDRAGQLDAVRAAVVRVSAAAPDPQRQQGLAPARVPTKQVDMER